MIFLFLNLLSGPFFVSEESKSSLVLYAYCGVSHANAYPVINRWGAVRSKTMQVLDDVGRTVSLENPFLLFTLWADGDEHCSKT
jgi:hypothetical protein